MKTFEEAKDKMLVALMGIGVTCLVFMCAQVYDLNAKIAVVISKVGDHEKRIDHLERK